MAENMSRKFATMSEEERRRFELEQEQAAAAADPDAEEAKEELDFEEPRDYPEGTKADLEERDGTGALVDEGQHERRVREQARARGRKPPDSA
jgi:NOL1/NOP2/fmu family ribosome biogenesis protein